jgi:hypothetical protein
MPPGRACRRARLNQQGPTSEGGPWGNLRNPKAQLRSHLIHSRTWCNSRDMRASGPPTRRCRCGAVSVAPMERVLEGLRRMEGLVRGFPIDAPCGNSDECIDGMALSSVSRTPPKSL